MTFRFIAPLVLFATNAYAQTPADARPIRVQSAPSEEPRYVGGDFPSWQVTQDLGTATEALRRSGTEEPVCIPWEALSVFESDARTCWCFTQSVTGIDVAAPTADGGCEITDDYGADGVGSCFTTSAGPKWKSPHYQLVRARAGGGDQHDGLCTVATSTTVGLGVSRRPPCRVTAECTEAVGSGACDPLSTSTGTLTASARTALRYTWGCSYVLLRSSEATRVYAEGGR